jgi:hypothetical protein
MASFTYAHSYIALAASTETNASSIVERSLTDSKLRVVKNVTTASAVGVLHVLFKYIHYFVFLNGDDPGNQSVLYYLDTGTGEFQINNYITTVKPSTGTFFLASGLYFLYSTKSESFASTTLMKAVSTDDILNLRPYGSFALYNVTYMESFPCNDTSCLILTRKSGNWRDYTTKSELLRFEKAGENFTVLDRFTCLNCVQIRPFVIAESQYLLAVTDASTYDEKNVSSQVYKLIGTTLSNFTTVITTGSISAEFIRLQSGSLFVALFSSKRSALETDASVTLFGVSSSGQFNQTQTVPLLFDPVASTVFDDAQQGGVMYLSFAYSAALQMPKLANVSVIAIYPFCETSIVP